MAQVENVPNKPVHLIFMCGALLLFFLMQWSIDWVVGYFGKAPSEAVTGLVSAIVAVFVALSLYKNDRFYGRVNEVASELKKVTWPSAKEVRAATIVVIVMSVVAAFIIGMVFDVAWSKLTELVYA